MRAQVPPNNLDAEISVLGGLLLDSEAWDNVVDILTEEDFYKPAHQKVFVAIKELHRKSQTVDIVTVNNYFLSRGELDTIGGAALLAEIVERVPSSANIKSYAEIVAEKATLRRMIQSCSEIITDAYDAKFDNVDAFIDQTEAKIFKITQDKKASGLVSAAEVVKSSLEKIEELYGQKSAITGVPSGFDELDRITSGFQSGELIIIAARPSMGKTAFALNIAAHAALKKQKKVAFFSLEMGKEQIFIRLLASEAKINISDVRVGRIPDAAWPKLIGAASAFTDSGLFIDETSGISPFEIRAKCRRMKTQYGLDMIMIDYLQMMELKQRSESREREVSEISKTLKAIAKELKIPVIALAQLNRGVEGRSDRRPMLSDLRESGSIEQDADLIMMLFRDEYYEKDSSDQKGLAEVLINKHRNGPTGVVKLAFVSQYGIFANLAPDSMMPPPGPERPRGGSAGGVSNFGGPQGGSGGASSGGSGGLKNFAPRN